MSTVSDCSTAETCIGTPNVAVIDNRGLVVRALQHNRIVAGAATTQLITQQRYGALGELLNSIDPRLFDAQQLDPSVVANFRYQSSLSGQVLRTQSQDAGEQVTLFDIEGGPCWQTNSRAQTRLFAYDTLHRLSSITEQDGAVATPRISERYLYGEGQPDAAPANSRGQLVRQYDTAGLNETPCFTIGAQPLQQIRQLLLNPDSDWQGDESQWPAQLEPVRYVSGVAYDALGEVVSTIDALGNRQRQQRNVAGQLASSDVTLKNAVARPILRAISYSAAGQVLREEAGNGVVSEYRYEPQTQRLDRLLATRPAQAGRQPVLQDLTYRYDPMGNILSIHNAALATRYHRNQRIEPANDYQYDALYQLLSASGRENASAGQQSQALPLLEVPISADPNGYSNYTRTYTYDLASNLTQIRHQGRSNYTLDTVLSSTSNHGVQQTGFVTPGDIDGFFDGCGNLKQLAPGQPLQWDGRNQLQQVTQVTRSGPDDDRENYQYDGSGARVRKITVSQTSGTQRRAEVIYLPGLELRRTMRTSGGSLTTEEELQVISAGGAGRQQVRLLHWVVGKPDDLANDQLRGSLDNQIGSSLLELDQDANLLTLEEYFPFGGTAVWSGKSASETQYKFVRYSGKERDATGLYYYGFRYYMPWLGRWLNPDPAGTIDGLNLFRMVRNNPITLNDLDGQMSGRGAAASKRSTSTRSVTRSGAAATVGQSGVVGRGGVSRPTVASAARTVAPGAAARSRTTVRAPVTTGRSTHQGVATRGGRTTVMGRPPVARAAAAAASPAVRPVTPPLAVEIGIATINLGEAAATSFFDENLGARLQNYKSAHAERFLAVEEGLSFPDADKNQWIGSFGAHGRFINAYKPHQWRFGDNWRFERAKFFAADVVVEQYTKVATQGGFFGTLPTEVVRQNVVNSVSKQYMSDARESGVSVEEFFEGFMTKTVNGKSTKRILEVFGLEAYGVTEIPQEKDVTLRVRQLPGR